MQYVFEWKGNLQIGIEEINSINSDSLNEPTEDSYERALAIAERNMKTIGVVGFTKDDKIAIMPPKKHKKEEDCWSNLI